MPQAEPLMLRDKVVVVTGGAGLLGRAFCTAIAARGGVAIVADIDSDRAERVAGEIRSSDGQAFASRLDITDCSSVDGLIADVRQRHGRLDAVVNNAYPRHANYGRRLEEVTYADFSASVAAHLGGYFLVSQRFAAHAAAHGGGTIVNIASIYGVLAPRFDLYEGLPMTMPVEYAAIKAAVIQLTRYFAQYFKQDAIRCNAVAPGGIRDGQPELFVRRYEAYCGTKGMLDPADVEGAVVFLLSDASRAITGQVLTVDDGFTL
jgi:NAD(P)-dependent dehydrogenase (short-subunit alcohol dehydrogenase family)